MDLDIKKEVQRVKPIAESALNHLRTKITKYGIGQARHLFYIYDNLLSERNKLITAELDYNTEHEDIKENVIWHLKNIETQSNKILHGNYSF